MSCYCNNCRAYKSSHNYVCDECFEKTQKWNNHIGKMMVIKAHTQQGLSTAKVRGKPGNAIGALECILTMLDEVEAAR